MTILRQIAESDMVLSWGEAELDRLAKDCGLPLEIVLRRRAGIRTPRDDQTICERISHCRGSMLDGLVNRGWTWHESRFAAHEFGAVRVVDGWDCKEVKTMAELLKKKPGFTFPVFELKQMLGCPIFVGTGVGGQWCLAEGTHRCLTAYRDRFADPIPVIVGISPRAQDWVWWSKNRDHSPRS